MKRGKVCKDTTMDEESSDYDLQGNSGPLPVFLNKVLLGQSCAHSCSCPSWLLSCYYSRVVVTDRPVNLNIFTILSIGENIY